ncbi:MAG: hypothetical protein MJZ15_03825 [Bacteroidales bacterium]|nr:hypothetical protein [Bacteroidales bacterium]
MKYIKHFGTREGYSSEENVLMSYDAFLAHFNDEDKSEVRWKGRLKNENEETEDNDEVLTVKALKFTTEGDATVGLSSKGSYPNFEISRDGKTWETWNDGSNVYATQSISADSPLYVRGDNPNGINKSLSKCASFKMRGDEVSCKGDIMYLLSYTKDLDTIPCDCCYGNMFIGCSNLVSAPKLSATTLTESCYNCMFYNCTSLVNAPELPATTLTKSCYNGMFNGCSNLVSAPKLSATTVAEGCCRDMFANCTSLITAPKLYATTLASYCYGSMFLNCSSLVNAPELPATTLASFCYDYMFHGCTSLITAPKLSATTLVDNCYCSMFSDCKKLQSITCLYEGSDLFSYTFFWLNNVSSDGTFYKSPNAQWNDMRRGGSYIPEGWSVEVYQG